MSKLENNTTSLQAILETVNNLPSAGSSTTQLETYTITFPDTALGSEKIYYLDENGNNQCLQRITTNKVDIIKVVKNSIVFEPSALWHNNITYVPDRQEHMQMLEEDSYTPGHAFIIKGDIVFSYSDNAPQ